MGQRFRQSADGGHGFKQQDGPWWPCRVASAAWIHSQMGPTGQSQRKAQAMDHSRWGNGPWQDKMEGMDQFQKIDHAPAASPRRNHQPYEPGFHRSDGCLNRQAAFPPLPGHKVHDKRIKQFFFLLDQSNNQDADEGSTPVSWDASGLGRR